MRGKRAPGRMLFAAALSLSVAMPALAQQRADVTVRPITQFRVGDDDRQFGSFEFVGGLVMSSRAPLFGSISGIRFRPDGRRFVAVLDTGHWMTGRTDRDAENRLSGLSDVVISPILDASGKEPRRKSDVDAESLVLDEGRVIVGFEGKHRIEAWKDPGFETSAPYQRLAPIVPLRELRTNGGLEAFAKSPASGPLAGAMVVVAERSVDSNGDLFAAILDGPKRGQFRVVHHQPFDVTDGVFLPGGDLLLLERRFNMAEGVGMRIRRIRGDDIRPGAVVDGDILLEADGRYQIDNMEGIDVIEGADGVPHIIIVSDDNHSFLQRNLMLEFRFSEVSQ